MTIKTTEKFEYENKNFNAKNLDAAMDKFIDCAWGIEYQNFLERNKMENSKIEAVKDVREFKEHDFHLLTQKLENGALITFQVFLNEDGSYTGIARENLGVMGLNNH